MKRDILIFPKFKNIDKIQNIRLKYDALASLLPPHITLVFPFTDDIQNDKLIALIKEKLKDFQKFNVTFKGVTIGFDTYASSPFIYLNCINGEKNLTSLHNTLYSIPVLSSHLNKNLGYTPHITLGHTDTIDFKLSDDFSATIDEIVIEEIGQNDESIIICKIKLE